MSAVVVATIGRIETVEQFVCRHRHGVFTNDVAARFGMDLFVARRELKSLERAGAIKSKRETTGNGSFAGAGLVWKRRES